MTDELPEIKRDRHGDPIIETITHFGRTFNFYVGVETGRMIEVPPSMERLRTSRRARDEAAHPMQVVNADRFAPGDVIIADGEYFGSVMSVATAVKQPGRVVTDEYYTRGGYEFTPILFPWFQSNNKGAYVPQEITPPIPWQLYAGFGALVTLLHWMAGR